MARAPQADLHAARSGILESTDLEWELRNPSMETRRTRFCPGAGGSILRLASGCVLFVVAGRDLVSRRGPVTTQRAASRKDAGASPVFIDKLIEEGWKKAGIKPAKPASDEEFLRRAYVDMLGRIPNVQEAQGLSDHARKRQAREADRVSCSSTRISPRTSRRSGRSC